MAVGNSEGQSKFCRITQISFVNQNVYFLCFSDYGFCYIEHLRPYELSAVKGSLSTNLQSDFKDNNPLAVWTIEGLLRLTPKRFIHLWQNYENLICNTKIQIWTANSLALFIFHQHRIPVLLNRRTYFQMCHPQNFLTDSLSVLIKFQHLLLMFS